MSNFAKKRQISQKNAKFIKKRHNLKNVSFLVKNKIFTLCIMPYYGKHRKASTKIAMAFRRRRLKKRVDARQNAKLKKLQSLVYSQRNEGWIDDVNPNVGVNSTGFITFDYCNLENIVAVANIASIGSQPATASNLTRYGNKITLKKLRLKVLWTNSITDIYNRQRMIVFVLPDPGVAPLLQIGDILETASIDSFYKKNSPVKYRILKDVMISTTCGNQQIPPLPSFNGMGGKPFVFRNITINFGKNGMPVHYKGAAAGDPIKNKLGMIFISDSTTTSHPSVKVSSRLTFDP